MVCELCLKEIKSSWEAENTLILGRGMCHEVPKTSPSISDSLGQGWGTSACESLVLALPRH